MDIPWAQEAADRLHAMLPPEVKEAEKAPRGFVPAAQLQEAMRMFDQTKAANMQIQEQMVARINALEAELKNQIQGRIAAERIKGEYGLAEVQIKEMNENQREAMKVQADVEKTSAKIQSDLIKEVGNRSRTLAEQARQDTSPAPEQPVRQEPRSAPDGPAPNLTFKDATLNDDQLSNRDMLMKL